MESEQSGPNQGNRRGAMLRECADFIQISPAFLLMATFPSGIQAKTQAAGSAHNSYLLWQGLGSSLS